MTIEQTGVIDIISVSEDDAVASLIISDHLPWDSDPRGHMLLVQNKVNEYLEFIEGETLYEARPDLRGKRLVLKVIAKFAPPKEAQDFYVTLQQHLASAGYPFVFQVAEQLKANAH